MVFSTRDTTLALETDEQTTIRRERLRTVDAIRRSLRGTNSRVTTSDESRLEMLITANSLNSKISANTVGDVVSSCLRVRPPRHRLRGGVHELERSPGDSGAHSTRARIPVGSSAFRKTVEFYKTETRKLTLEGEREKERE